MLNKKCIMVAGCFGYIGNALTQKLLIDGYRVIGIDNCSREDFVQRENSYSATKQPSWQEKETLFHELGDFYFYRRNVSSSFGFVKRLISNFKPFTIVNLAHQPSAPHSQKSQWHSEYALINNIKTTNNFLWAIKEINADIHYTTIGSTGEYSHVGGIDIEEGYFKVEHNGRKSNELIYPRQANSAYHASKIGSFYLTEYLTRIWDLKTTEAEQSVVFGLYTKETNDTKIYSRLDTDSCFGTVLNKFIVQALLNIPLTIFGEGKHQRGFLALQNSIDAIMLSIENPPETGKCRTFNQLSEWHSMNTLAERIKTHAKKIKNIDVYFNHIPSPRKEFTGEHYYHYVSKILPSLGYKPNRTIENEIEYIFNILDIDYIQGLKESIVTNINF